MTLVLDMGGQGPLGHSLMLYTFKECYRVSLDHGGPTAGGSDACQVSGKCAEQPQLRCLSHLRLISISSAYSSVQTASSVSAATSPTTSMPLRLSRVLFCPPDILSQFMND